MDEIKLGFAKAFIAEAEKDLTILTKAKEAVNYKPETVTRMIALLRKFSIKYSLSFSKKGQRINDWYDWYNLLYDKISKIVLAKFKSGAYDEFLDEFIKE